MPEYRMTQLVIWIWSLIRISGLVIGHLGLASQNDHSRHSTYPRPSSIQTAKVRAGSPTFPRPKPQTSRRMPRKGVAGGMVGFVWGMSSDVLSVSFRQMGRTRRSLTLEPHRV